jgi:multisubunit Na+/H+ antiporter MnhG subunit
MWRFYQLFFNPEAFISWGNFFSFLFFTALFAAPNIVAVRDIVNREHKNPLRVLGSILCIFALAGVYCDNSNNVLADIIGAFGIVLAAYIYTLFRNDALKRGRSWGTAWVVQGWIFALITSEILIVFLQFLFDAQVQ